MTHTNPQKIAVLMGGNSAEREVSLRSGAAVLASLQRQGLSAFALDPRDADFIERLRSSGANQVFIMLHGRGGEDGSMQGLLEIMGLSYTGSGVTASALAMNKFLTKQIWRGAGLPTPEAILLSARQNWREVVERLGLPLMVKPACEGSSVGMSKVNSAEALEAAWQLAAHYDNKVMAERFVSGREYTAAVVAGQALPLIRLETPRVFYDYEAKYHADDTRYICPCGLPREQERELQALALQAFECLGAKGWGRIDFMLASDNRPWLLEINTAPGMTDHSLVPMAAQAAGIDFDALVRRILETAS
jgi:D-alanine-D-alanine ligase